MAVFVGGPKDGKTPEPGELTEEKGPPRAIFSAKQTIEGKPLVLLYELDANGNYFWIGTKE